MGHSPMSDVDLDTPQGTQKPKGKKPSKSGLEPGKVAGTNNYGEGGPGVAPPVPGKRSSTDQLPADGDPQALEPGKQSGVDAKDGDASDAKQTTDARSTKDGGETKDGKEAKDKDGGADGGKGAAKQDEAKGDKKDAKKDGGGEGKDGAKKDGKQADEAAVAAKQGGKDGKTDAVDGEGGKAAASAPATKPAPPPVGVSVPSVSAIPAIQLDAPKVNKATSDRWLKETGQTPEAHHAQIQGALTQLTSEVTAAQNELMSHSTGLHSKLQADIDTRIATFASTVIAPGRARVNAAYDGIGKTVESSAQAAVRAVGTHKQTGAKSIQSTLPQKKGELTKKLTTAKGSIEALVAKHAPAATAVIKKFAAGLLPKIDQNKQRANDKAKAEAKQFDPAKGSGDAAGGPGLAGGKLSLRNEVYQKLIGDEGKKVGDKYDDALRPLSVDIDKKAAEWIKTEITESAGELESVLSIYEKTSVKALEDTAKDATKGLDAQETTAKKSIELAKTESKTRIAADKKTALATADAAGKSFKDNVKAAGTELLSNLEKRAAGDAKSYATITANLQAKLAKRGPQRFEQVQPEIAAAKAELQKLHEANKRGLSEMVTACTTELGGSIKKHQDVYQTAIKAREEEAGRVEAAIKKDVMKGADDMGAHLSNIGQGFTDTVVQETAKIDGAVQKFNTSGETALQGFTTKLGAKIQEIQAAADQEFETAYAGTFEKAVQAQAETEIKAKEKQLITDASTLRGAFDGWGTDEGGVFAVLRKCSYGEIEMLQGAYNHHYSNRGKDGRSPLRADIWDEMSGSDYKIATAYLDHRRNDAVKLELKQASRGFWGTDHKRVESVLRTCNDAEIHHLNTDAEAKRALLMCRVNMFDKCSLDVMDTLLDEKLTKEDRHSKASAVRLFQAMNGWGTDEAKMTEILEGAQSEDERRRLRQHFNAYAGDRGWDTGNPADENNDALALAIKGDTSGGEEALFLELAREKQNKQLIAAARMHKAADGGGTDEHALFDALDDEAYAKEWAEADPDRKKELEAQRKARLSQNLQDVHADYDSIDGLIKGETTHARYTWEELQAGVKKDGTPIDTPREKQLLRTVPAHGRQLERMVAERKLQTGRCEPELLIAYACWGVDGTDEELINKALSKGGEPLPRGDVQRIKRDFKACWGVDLVVIDEITSKTLVKDPGGLLSDELGGKDWFKTRILLCGIPETPQQQHYINMLRDGYATSGVLSGLFMDAAEAIGATDAKSTLEHTRQREAEAFADIQSQGLADKSFTEIEADAKAEKSKDKPDRQKILAAQTMEDFQLLSTYMEQDSTAYAETVSALVDAVVTTLEIIGGVLISIATMGAGSPILVAFLANLALSAGMMVLKAAVKGDQYGTGDVAADAIAALGTAGFGALGETKAIMNVADGVGQKVAGKFFVAAEEGLSKGGMRVIQHQGKWAVELSKEGIARVERIVAAGTKNVLLSTGQEIYSTLTNEKTYEMKFEEALWGENSLGRRILTGAPRAFAEGLVAQWINEKAGASNINYPKGTIESAPKNALWNAIAEMGGNTAGFLVYLDNYQDTEHFWTELFKSNIQKGLTGYASGYLMHKNRHKKLAADFIRNDLDVDGLMNMYDKLDDIEQKKLAEFVMKYGTPEAKAALPEAYRKHLSAPPAETTAPASGTTTTTTPPAPITEPGGSQPGGEPEQRLDEKRRQSEQAAEEKPPVSHDTHADDEATKPAAVTKPEDEHATKPRASDEEAAKPKPVVEPEDEHATKPAPVSEDEAKKQAAHDDEAKQLADDETKKLADEPKLPATDEDGPSTKAAETADAKTRDEDGRQTEKPDAETDEAARTRRSAGLKPTLPDAKVEDWAQPNDRKGVPNHVPLSRQELRDLIADKYQATMAKYLENQDFTKHPEYNDLIKRLAAEQPGSIDKKKAAAYLAEWTEIGKVIEAKTGRSEADLRTLYNVVEHDDFPAWFTQVEHLPKEQQAKLGHMWREEWKLFVRDMMTDEGSKEVLYLRDRAMSGDRRGGRFADFLDRGLDKHDGDVDKSLQGIIDSSKRSNTAVNKATTGSESGLNEEIAAQIRGSAKQPKTTPAGDGDLADGTGTQQAKHDEAEPKPKPVAKDDADDTVAAKPKDEDTSRPADLDDDQAKAAKQRATDTPQGTKPPDRDDKVAAQMQQGHAGIEVHSHFLGNVDPKTFRAVIAESGLAPMKKGDPAGSTASEKVGDTTSWEPVLREIVALEKAGFAHQYQTAVDPTTGQQQHVIDPETGKPVVKVRGRSGDAIEQAKQAQQRIAELKEQLVDPKLTDAERAKIKDKIYREARSAAEKALRASDETDFNSAYEVRDELIKKFYGESDRKEMLQAAGANPDAKLFDAPDAYRDYFAKQGRTEVVERIEKALKAKAILDDENRRSALGPDELKRLTKDVEAGSKIPEQFAYDRFAKDTVLRLVQDGLTYSEQSNSTKKLTERFDPQQLDQIKRELIAEHPDLKDKIEAFELKHVAMVNTNLFGTRGNVDQQGQQTLDLGDLHPKAKEERVSRKDFETEVKKVVEQTKRGDIAGVDIAGAEHFSFDKEGAARFGHLYKELLAAAQQRGEPIVLRPHVGEGANDVMPGKHGMRDADRQMDRGELSHYRRAKDNLDALLTTLDGIAKQYPTYPALPPDVIVRFGHATHATPEQAARMAKLGIIAEVNLSSNVETGSVSQKKPTSATEDRKRGAEDRGPLKNTSQQRGGKLEDHSLATLIMNDVPIILSTDGHSVMSTTMKREYDLAQKAIDKVLASKQGIPMSAEQAKALGVKGVGVPGPDVVVKLKDIPPEHRGKVEEKFRNAMRKLYDDANDYYDKRPKQGDGAPPADDPPPPPVGHDAGPATTEAVTHNVRAPATEGEQADAQKIASSTDKLSTELGQLGKPIEAPLTQPPEGKPVLQQSASDALIGLPVDVIPPTASAAEALARFKEKGIPRWGALTENERKHESAFASSVEKNLEQFVNNFFAASKGKGDSETYQFEVDGAKKMYAAYGAGKEMTDAQLEVRATANHALHPTAVAIARLAFLKRLDQLQSLAPDDPLRHVFVTNGGCASGKGSLFGVAEGQLGKQNRFGAVWDAAGEGDAQENGWILQAAKARGLKVTYGFVENDPMANYKGVLERALSTGRIVDPVTYARSYVRGQANMKEFLSSPEYQEMLASGQVQTFGVNAIERRKNPDDANAGLLGDNGRITADHIPDAPDEVAVTEAAIRDFKEWLARKQKEDPNFKYELWLEGGGTNALKFKPGAGA